MIADEPGQIPPHPNPSPRGEGKLLWSAPAERSGDGALDAG